MQIRELSYDRDISRIRKLIWETFMRFQAPYYPPEGRDEFRRTIYSDEIMEMQEFHGAFEDGRLVGVIATRSGGSHISFLFVDGERQGKGIGKALVEHVIPKSERDQITVNSAHNAAGFYRAMGFRALSEPQTVRGITFVPMARRRDLPAE